MQVASSRLQTASPTPQETGKKVPRGRKSKKQVSPDSGLTDQIKTRLFDLRKAGFNRLYQAGQVFEFSTPESLLDIRFDQPVFMLVDRLAVSAESRTRIVDAVETAYRESGEVIFDLPPHERAANPPIALCANGFLECAQNSANSGMRNRSQELFSFNNPYGACPRCQGFWKHDRLRYGSWWFRIP